MDGELRRRGSARLKRAIERAGERIARGAPLLLMLDLDGTLTDFEVDPKDVSLPAATRKLLDRFVRAGARVVIVTGRDAKSTAAIVRVPRLEIVGLHGRETLRGKRLVRRPVARTTLAALGRLLAIARALAADLPGSRVEDKRPGGVAFHTRGAKQRDAKKAEAVLARAIAREKKHGVEPMNGKRVVEARAAGCSKGTAVRSLLEETADGAVALFAGDDLTDEDAHRALAKTGALTVLVSKRPRPTHAKLRAPGIPAFARALARLAWYLPIPTLG